MTPAPPEPVERHTAPALWLVVLALVGTTLTAVAAGARIAAAVLVATLVGAATARLIGRGRRPEGIAVRSTWLDVTVLLLLAGGIGLLMLAPGVAPDPGAAGRSAADPAAGQDWSRTSSSSSWGASTGSSSSSVEPNANQASPAIAAPNRGAAQKSQS